MRLIDLRSDTVTQPSPLMRQRIAEAAVGDDVFDEDPTVHQLQEKISELLGKEAALFVPSGTMGNEICIKCHTQPGEEVICDHGSHVLNYESGAASLISGVQLRTITGNRGVITADQVEAAINPAQYYHPKTSMMVIENTHNVAGGTIFPIEESMKLYALAQKADLKLHLDGARIWNAAIATGISVKEYAKYCDSICVSFSKGLGAPIGSAVAGSKKFIEKARRIRKVFGGGMRQVGILAAGALFALENNFELLAEDHKNARFLAEQIATIPGINLDPKTVETNIVIFDIEKTGKQPADLMEALKSKGVLVVQMGKTMLRAVTHLHITQQDILDTAKMFKEILVP